MAEQRHQTCPSRAAPSGTALAVLRLALLALLLCGLLPACSRSGKPAAQRQAQVPGARNGEAEPEDDAQATAEPADFTAAGAASAPATQPEPPLPPRFAQNAARPAAKVPRYESSIRKFEQDDRTSPPPQGATLFVGSSSIRYWKTLADDFQPLPVLNRGFGGAVLPEMLYYFDRIVTPYRPRRIFLYGGDNDIASRRTPEQVLSDVQSFARRVHAALPEADLYFVSMKPSPARVRNWPRVQEGNRLIREWCAQTRQATYIDITAEMLDGDGQPRPELFVRDKLHLNAAGYAIWTRILKDVLAQEGNAPTGNAAR